MKMYGRSVGSKSPPEAPPAELAEVTIEANSDELRAIAWFLISVANEMGTKGSEFEIAHLSTSASQFEGPPHLSVTRSQSPDPEIDLETALREFENMRDMLDGGGNGPSRA